MSKHQIFTIHRRIKDEKVSYYVAPKGTKDIEYTIVPFPYPKVEKSKWEKRFGCLLLPLKIFFFIADFFNNVVDAVDTKINKALDGTKHKRLIVMDNESQDKLVVAKAGKDLIYKFPSDLKTTIATLFFYQYNEKTRKYGKGREKKHGLVIHDDLYATFVNENLPSFNRYYFQQGEQKIAFFNLIPKGNEIGECAILKEVTREKTMYLLGSILFRLYPTDFD